MWTGPQYTSTFLSQLRLVPDFIACESLDKSFIALIVPGFFVIHRSLFLTDTLKAGWALIFFLEQYKGK